MGKAQDEISDADDLNYNSEEETDNENDKKENYLETEANDESNESNEDNKEEENDDKQCNYDSTDDKNSNLNEDSDSVNTEPIHRKRIIVADDSDDEIVTPNVEGNFTNGTAQCGM